MSAAGPIPVLLPGNMCDARMWRAGGHIHDMLTRHGLPDPLDADLTRDDSIAGMAARTLAAGKGPLLPIGFSMGAIVAIEMAAQAPERIAGAVLLGVNAGADLPERAAHRPAQQAEVRGGGLQRVLVEELKPNYLAPANRTDENLLALLLDMGLALGPEVFVRQSEALRLRADRRGALTDFAFPILYGCGADDALCPPEWHRRWAVLTRRAELRVFEGAGHMLPLENPVALADAVDLWLERELPI